MIPDSQEIQQAVFSLGSLKSPGQMVSLHYSSKHTRAKQEGTFHLLYRASFFFPGNFLLKRLKYPHIALIPKGENSVIANNFRPIGLCNVVCKIISKILANRLKTLLPKLISPFQSAFRSGRGIQDNSIVAHKIMHFLDTYRGKDHYTAIKIDMEKTFDKVEWSLLLSIMRSPGFAKQWIH